MERVLTVDRLSVSTKQRTIVDNISFNVDEGEALLLSGTNGAGKSTVLKSILRLETEGKTTAGSIIHRTYGDILRLDADALQKFRSDIVYVQQRDEYAEMGNIQVRDIFSDSTGAHSGRTLSYAEVNDLIDEWIPRRSDHKRIFDAKSKPATFSGGEQRLLSILSAVATRSDASLMVIDEPLNNLDYINARYISNLINKAIRSKPSTALIMVSHCRIFPFINREVKLLPSGIAEIAGSYACHSCFGEPDKDGFYCCE